MKVIVNLYSNIEIQAKPTEPIGDFIKKIATNQGIYPADPIRLTFKGVPLDKSKTLADYKIKDRSDVDLTMDRGS